MQQRNKIRFIFIAALIGIICLIQFVTLTPAKAQTPWSFTFDFTTSNYGWEDSNNGNAIPYEIWSSGTGFVDQCVNAFSTYYQSVRIKKALSFGSGTIVTALSVTYDDSVTDGNLDFDGAVGIEGSGDVYIWEKDSGTNITKSWTGSVSVSTTSYVFLQIVGSSDTTSCQSGNVTLKSFTISGTGDDPFEEEDIENPDDSIANIYDYCVLLGADASTFTNLPGKWIGTPTPRNADGEFKGLLATNGKYSLQLTLSKERQYILATKFRVTDPTRAETFGIQLGASPGINN